MAAASASREDRSPLASAAVTAAIATARGKRRRSAATAVGVPTAASVGVPAAIAVVAAGLCCSDACNCEGRDACCEE